MKKATRILIASALAVAVGSSALMAACDKHEHEYGDWEITAPTETQTGLAEKTCISGDDTVQVVLPVLGDSSYTKGQDTATCTATGRITYEYITSDGEQISFQIRTPAKGHQLEKVEFVAADTEHTGTIEHWHCTVCGKDFDAEEDGNVLSSVTIPRVYKDEITESTRIRFTDAINSLKYRGITDTSVVTGTGVALNDGELYTISDGVFTVGTADKYVNVLTSGDTIIDGESFSGGDRIFIGGRMNADSRYIKIVVSEAATIKVYLKTGSTASDKRALFITDTPKQVNTADDEGVLGVSEVLSGKSTAYAVTFTVAEGGSYYLGTNTLAVYFYGMDVTLGEVNPDNPDDPVTYDEILSESKLITFENIAAGTYTTVVENFADGVTTGGSSDKVIVVADSSATIEGVSFTKSVDLGGKMNEDSRYIELKVSGACTVTLYIKNGASKDGKYVVMTNGHSAGDTADTTVLPEENKYSISGVATNTVMTVTFTIIEAGTYCFGTNTGGIYVYGLDVAFAAAE